MARGGFFKRIREFFGGQEPEKESPKQKPIPSPPPPPPPEPPKQTPIPPGISRSELIDQIIERKERLWGQGDRKFNPQRSARNVARDPKTHGPVNIALLKWAANASDSELITNVAQYGFLFYK